MKQEPDQYDIKRQHERFVPHPLLPERVYIYDANGKPTRAIIMDISEGGIGLMCEELFSTNKSYSLILKLPLSTKDIKGSGTVRHSTYNEVFFFYGMQLELEGNDRLKLSAYLKKRTNDLESLSLDEFINN